MILTVTSIVTLKAIEIYFNVNILILQSATILSAVLVVAHCQRWGKAL